MSSDTTHDAKNNTANETQQRVFTPLHGASVLVGVLGYYLPADVMKPGLKRTLARTAGLVASMGLFVKASANQEVGGPKVARTVDVSEKEARAKLKRQLKANSKAKNAAIGAAAFGTVGLGVYTSVKIDEWFANVLRKRGVKYPSTVGGTINLVLAVVSLLVDKDWKFGTGKK